MVFLNLYTGEWLDRVDTNTAACVDEAVTKAQRAFDSGFFKQAQIRDMDGVLLVDMDASGGYTDLTAQQD